MKIAIYSRKSRLSEKGESIKNQIDICKDYCRLYENPEFIIYEDEGFTGGNTDRPAFHKMMKDIKKNKIDAVACYKLDRISRNVSDFSSILEVLNQHNVAFLSVKEHFDTSTPMGRAMMYITSVFAQLERETIAERLRDNMRRLARTGRWLGGVTPTGFDYEKVNYVDEHMNEKKMCRLVPVEEELELVKLLFEKFVECGSKAGVLRYTLQNGIKTKRGSNFCTRGISNILTNPVYVKSDEDVFQYYKNLGCDLVNDISEYKGNGILLTNRYEHHKSKITERNPEEWVLAIASHKGIVPSDIFLKTQEILEKNKKNAPRTFTSTLALASSLIVCPECGGKMYVFARTKEDPKKVHYYYRCRLKMTSNSALCNSQNLHGKKTDDFIVEELKKLAQKNKEELIASLKSEKKDFSNSITEQTNRRTAVESELSELDAKIQNLTEQLSENSASAAAKYIIQQIESYDEKRSALKSELYTIENELENLSVDRLNYNILFQKLTEFAENVDTMDMESKKGYIREIVEKIEVTGNKLKIHLRF